MKLNNITFKNIATDSKDVKKNDLFVAIKGERFDGHDFVREAFNKGAVAAVVQDQIPRAGTLITVKDTRKELSKLIFKFDKHILNHFILSKQQNFDLFNNFNLLKQVYFPTKKITQTFMLLLEKN